MEARKSLSALSEVQLRDIGLTEHDVFLDLQSNNSDGTGDFEEIRKSRTGNW